MKVKKRKTPAINNGWRAMANINIINIHIWSYMFSLVWCEAPSVDNFTVENVKVVCWWTVAFIISVVVAATVVVVVTLLVIWGIVVGTNVENGLTITGDDWNIEEGSSLDDTTSSVGVSLLIAGVTPMQNT